MHIDEKVYMYVSYLVIAQTNPEAGHRGINVLIVESDWEGVSIGAKEDKLGIRSSDTHTIMYSDVKVPKENRIGEDGFGFKFAMKTLSRSPDLFLAKTYLQGSGD